MSLELSNKRLLEELKTVISLLKMKIRTESSAPNKDYNKLLTALDSILKHESQVLSQVNYYTSLESEIKQLRNTCEKFSELTESVSLIHQKYKNQVTSLTQEKTKLSEEILNIR
jgi:DNA repair ATPase RecN